MSVQPLTQLTGIIQRIFFSIRKDLEVLQPYLDDEAVSEIMVNGTNHVFVETKGTMKRVDICFESTEELEEMIRRIAGKVHKDINELNPIVDARMEDGSRINAVYKNIALNGPILTVRKFPKQAIAMDHLVHWGTITQEAADCLKKLVRCGYNIFISGGTSSGKTTFSKRLSVQLLALGLAPFPLEMDNYFINRDRTPLDEHGKPDFESLKAMDTKLLSENLNQLMSGEELVLPLNMGCHSRSWPLTASKLSHGRLFPRSHGRTGFDRQ